MPTILPPVKPLIIQHSYDAPSGMVSIFDGESHNKNEINLTVLIKLESIFSKEEVSLFLTSITLTRHFATNVGSCQSTK